MTTIVAALLGAGVLISSVPAFAQGVQVDVPGVGVRVGDPDHRYRERERERDRIRAQRDLNEGSCRSVTERLERPDGSSATRTVRKCD